MAFKILTGTQNPTLRTVAAPVPARDLPRIAKLANAMVDYVRDERNGSVGLAAPQVGELVRVIAVTLLRSPDDETAPTVAMINPVILEASEERSVYTEGCLSIPGEFDEVSRPERIKVRYLDSKGKERTLYVSGYASHAVQHEIDHLDGILFVDRIANDLLAATSSSPVP